MGSLEHHRLIDLALAALLAVVTFKVAYQACVVLGEVLLQTSPQRGAAGGRIENFQRVTREVRIVIMAFPYRKTNSSFRLNDILWSFIFLRRTYGNLLLGRRTRTLLSLFKFM